MKACQLAGEPAVERVLAGCDPVVLLPRRISLNHRYYQVLAVRSLQIHFLRKSEPIPLALQPVTAGAGKFFTKGQPLVRQARHQGGL